MTFPDPPTSKLARSHDPCSELPWIYSGASLQGTGPLFVPWREVVLFSEVTNVLSLWGSGVLCSEVVLFSEVINVLLYRYITMGSGISHICPLFRGCPLFRVSTIGGSIVQLTLLYSCLALSPATSSHSPCP